LITRKAEDAAGALTRQTQAQHVAARADAARERLADAERRAHQLEDSAQERRWEALRTETEQRFDRLRAEERRFAERTRQAHTALGALRSQVGLLEQVQQVEQQLAALHPDTAVADHPDDHPDGDRLDGDHAGAEHGVAAAETGAGR